MIRRKKKLIIKPQGVQKVLLHTCCAPCASAIIEWMMREGIEPVIFYSNSNIYPYDEYEKRRSECERYAQNLGLTVIEDEYNHADWLATMKGLEHEPERGIRCERCFRYRLRRAADYASSHGFDTLTSALASSRWKSVEQVGEAGREVTEEKTVRFWDQNWRICGLSDRRREILQSYDFYNQQYCGCEFSLRDTLKARREREEKDTELLNKK